MRVPAPVGVLLLNLGTPSAPTPAAVRRYLRQFLSDPRVLDLPALARWLLLHLVILPIRPRRSAEAYAKVWTDAGSPLLVHSRELARAVGEELGAGYRVELGMRYGEPSIASAVDRLAAAGCARLVAFPLYAQATSSSTGSSLQEVFRVLSALWSVPPVAVVPPFHSDAGYLAALADRARPVLEQGAPEHVLFSFHGVPERHLRRAPEGAGCLRRGCCDRLEQRNAGCYRAQCHETARRVADALGLQVPFTVAFQSRLGRTPWIGPHVDELLDRLAADGVRRVAIVPGSFVADCLETLEELGLRAREAFREKGGEELCLVPALNSDPAWVRAAAELVRRTAGVGSP